MVKPAHDVMELLGIQPSSAEHGRLLMILRHVDLANLPVVTAAFNLAVDCADQLPIRTIVDLCRPAEYAQNRDHVLVVDVPMEWSQLIWISDLPAVLKTRKNGTVLRVMKVVR